MANPFSETLASIERERRVWRLSVGLLAAVTLVAWLGWSVGGSVELVATSRECTLHSSGRVHEVAVATRGRIAQVIVQLDDDVEAGQALFVVDGRDIEIAIAEQTQIASTAARALEAIDRELEARHQLLDAQRVVARKKAKELGHEHRAARSSARLARREYDSLAPLRDAGAATESEIHRAKEAASRLGAVASAVRAASDVVDADADVSAASQVASIARLERDRTSVLATIESTRAERARLQLALERLTIRAPVTGRVGSVDPVAKNAVIEPGQVLATIVPADPPVIHAALAPQDALGRIAPGQAARLYLDAFPWLRFGTVAATVQRVARQPREGLIDVELSIDPTVSLPLAHGLTGRVDVIVETVAPYELMLRALGRATSRRKDR